MLAADIDPFCACGDRPQRCGQPGPAGFTAQDVIGRDDGWDVVLAGDVFYDKPFAERLLPWFRALAGAGRDVLVGDPGRSYLPSQALEPLAVYDGGR